MAADDQDIFGKIDALLEKRVGFGSGGKHRHPDDDFPLLTEVVEQQSGNPPVQDRRYAERRKGERRQGASGRLDVPLSTLTEEQFSRFLARFEQKLEDLFIRQQLRLEDAVRRALQGQGDNARDKASDPL